MPILGFTALFDAEELARGTAVVSRELMERTKTKRSRKLPPSGIIVMNVCCEGEGKDCRDSKECEEELLEGRRGGKISTMIDTA